MGNLGRVAAAAAVGMVMAWSGECARAVEVVRLVATGEPTPDGAGTFAGFSPPTFRESAAVFRATTNGSGTGIYVYTGSEVINLAKTFTAAPGGGFFYEFGTGPDLGAGMAVFQASGSRNLLYGPSFQGIYGSDGTNVFPIVDTGTTVPGHTVRFTSFGGSPRFRENAILFTAASSAGKGLYGATPLGLRRVADSTMTMPGSTKTFAEFLGADLGTERGAFVAESTDGFRGIYTFSSSGLTRVADVNTPRPDGGGAFGTLGDQVAIHGSNVVFTSGSGVYASFDGYLVKILNSRMNPPQGDDQFNAVVSSPEVEGYGAVFSAATPSRTGLYAGNGGDIWTLLDNTAPLDGKSATAFHLGNSSLENETVVFRADFSDSSSAIYGLRKASVPVGSWLKPVQRLRVAGAGGFQVLRHNYTLGTTTVSAYAESPNLADTSLARGQWTGNYLYDYWSGRFTAATYRHAETGL